MKRKFTGGLLCVLAALLWLPAAVHANRLFTDGAVLQQGMPVPIFGTADEADPVTVTLGGQTVRTVAQNGQWRVNLAPLKAGGPFTLTIAGPRNTITVRDVLVGEVWVCGGQSNMELTLSRTRTGPAAIKSAADPLLHILTVARAASETPLSDFTGQWQAASPETVREFSAVGYFFGRDLRRALGVPVGLIQSCFGGTSAEYWVSRPALQADPALRGLLKDLSSALKRYPQALADYQARLPVLEQQYQTALQTYTQALALAKQNGTKPPAPPKPPVPPGSAGNDPKVATHLYNGMIAPLIPYGIRGVIWYQGENNVGKPAQYADLFPTLIADWRGHWGEGNFPFLFVQLAPYLPAGAEPAESHWAQLREAQHITSITVPNTAMAVITDVGERGSIHPSRKEPVGDRLAQAAFGLVYKRPVEPIGPMYQSLSVQGRQAVLHFTHLGGGLVADPAGPLTGFTIAGADRHYVAADAVIVGDTVVSSPQAPQPAAVRFGWADFPVVNLWGRAGLPTSPFGTDPFPPSAASAPRP